MDAIKAFIDSAGKGMRQESYIKSLFSYILFNIFLFYQKIGMFMGLGESKLFIPSFFQVLI